MSLCRCTQAHLTLGMQAQGHPARSGVTAYWGYLRRGSDEEDAYETQVSVPASWMTPTLVPHIEVTCPHFEVTSGT